MPRTLAVAATIEELLEDPPTGDRCQVALGRIVGLDGAGGALVALDGEPDSARRSADTTTPIGPAGVGSRVTLILPAGGGAPVITGVIQRTAAPALAGAAPTRVTLDGESLLLEAQREIVLRCGKSSITLSREGKIVIRGADLLEASTGRHRIRGSTVEIN